MTPPPADTRPRCAAAGPEPRQLGLDLLPCAECGANRPEGCRGRQGSRYTGDGYAAAPGGGPEGETCGSCRHAVEHRGRGRWYKCDLCRERWTYSAATDIHLRAPACVRWEPRRREAPSTAPAAVELTPLQHEEIARLLPASLADIVAAIGVPATLRLVERWGGGRVSVPGQAPPAGHELVRVLGRAAANALTELCGGEDLEVPIGAAAKQAERNARIVALHRAGQSAAVIARSLGMAHRSVRRLLRQAGEPATRD